MEAVVDISPGNKMFKMKILRGLISEKMTAAVQEVLAAVEATVAGYEEEVLSLKRELGYSERKLHAILQPQVLIYRTDVDGVGATGCTSSHSADECEWRHEQSEAENDCSESEKCKEENGAYGVSSSEEESECAFDLPSDFVSGPAHSEERLEDDSINSRRNTEVKRRRRLPARYRTSSHGSDGHGDNYNTEKNRDNEWKPNRNKKRRSYNVKKKLPIKLKLGLLESSSGADLLNNAFRLEGPVQTRLCQQNLNKSGFIKLLRSTFSELGENAPFEVYLVNGAKKSVPRQANKMTLTELYKTVRCQEQRKFVLYLQRKEHDDPCDTLTVLPDEKPITNGLKEETEPGTEGSRDGTDELDVCEDGDEDDDDDYCKPVQNSDDEEHSAAPKKTREQTFISDSCKVCGYLFRSQAFLVKHALSHLENPKRMCGVCGQQLESTEGLKTHLESHQKLHHCDTCGQYFLAFASFQKHIALHRIEKPLKCHIRLNVFGSNGSLKKHALRHDNGASYKCDVCPQAFKFKSLLQNHAMKHTGEKPFCCDVCGKSLTTYRGLCQHKLIHSGEKSYSCQQCGKRFYTIRFLTRHKKIHTVRERKYLCDVCSKTFINQSDLVMHQRTHDQSNIVKCPLCDKLLKGNLGVHMRVHSGEKPFTCDECDKKFTSQAHLKTHMLIHQGVKPLTCAMCGYKCLRKHYLDSHMRMHTGYKPYKCTQCDKAFTQSHCLKTHMKSHQTQVEVLTKE